MKNELRKAKKPFELPHGYIILLCVMLLVAALTWIIPAGVRHRAKSGVRN